MGVRTASTMTTSRPLTCIGSLRWESARTVAPRRSVRLLTDQSANGQPAPAERLAIAGSGAIACGLAALAAQRGDVVVWARSDGSAEKADRRVRALCEKAGASVNGNVRVTCDSGVLAEATFVVEA